MKAPLFLGLRTTIYKVSDIDKAKAWYAKVFETEPYFDQSFYVGFNIGGYELGLQPESVEVLNKTTNVVAYWGVSDIDKGYAHFINNGAISNEKPTNVGGDVMTATLMDPWGNIIGIIDNPDFKLPN